MKLLQPLILSLLIILATNKSTASKTILPNLAKQSGPDYGNSYGNSIKIDPYNNRLFVTGTTYGNFWDSDNNNDIKNEGVRETELSGSSRCFLGIYDWSTKIWTKKTFRSENPSKIKRINESCHKIEIINNGTKVLLLGYTHNNGILDDLMGLSSSVLKPPNQYGMILDINIDEKITKATTMAGSYKQLNIHLIGGKLLQDGPVQYPIDMTLIPNNKEAIASSSSNANDNDLFVVSMQSYDSTNNKKKNSSVIIYEHPNHTSQEKISHPNYSEKTHFKYGSTSSLLAERFSYNGLSAAAGNDNNSNLRVETEGQLTETYANIWRELYGTQYMESTVDIVGVIPDLYLNNDDNLIIIGNTAEIGFIYGKRSTTPEVEPKKNRDGFITKLSKKDGKIINKVNGGKIENVALRIESINYQDDEINGYCYDKETLYLVGTTKGEIIDGNVNGKKKMNSTINNKDDIKTRAFIVAIDLQSFTIKWTTHVTATSTAHGITCSVSKDYHNQKQDILYWGGNIYGGGSIILNDNNLDGDNNAPTTTGIGGGDDIFISQLSLIDGTINHIHQWGTPNNHDDTLTDIQSDINGNAIVMGNTNGGIFHHQVKVQHCDDNNGEKPTKTTIAQDGDTLTDVFFFTLDRDFTRLQKISNEINDLSLTDNNIPVKCENDDDSLFNSGDDEYNSGDDGYNSADDEYNSADDEYNSGDDEYNSGDDGDEEEEEEDSSEIYKEMLGFEDGDEEEEEDSSEIYKEMLGFENKYPNSSESEEESDDQYYLEFDDDNSSNKDDSNNNEEKKVDENKNTGKPDDDNIENKDIRTVKPDNDKDKKNDNNDANINHDKILGSSLNNKIKVDNIESTTTKNANAAADHKGKSWTKYIFYFVFLCILSIVLMLSVCGTWNSDRKGPYDVPTDRKHITKYLHGFDSNGIDVRHSATGGWHGAYQSDLAEGINTMDPNAGLFPNWRRSSINNTIQQIIKPTTTISTLSSNHSRRSMRNNNNHDYGELLLFADDNDQTHKALSSNNRPYKDADSDDDDGHIQLVGIIGGDDNDISSKTSSYNYDGFEDDNDDESWMVADDRLVDDYYLNDHVQKMVTDPMSIEGGGLEESGSLLQNNLKVADII